MQLLTTLTFFLIGRYHCLLLETHTTHTHREIDKTYKKVHIQVTQKGTQLHTYTMYHKHQNLSLIQIHTHTHKHARIHTNMKEYIHACIFTREHKHTRVHSPRHANTHTDKHRHTNKKHRQAPKHEHTVKMMILK